jgi:hypothetical protein
MLCPLLVSDGSLLLQHPTPSKSESKKGKRKMKPSAQPLQRPKRTCVLLHEDLFAQTLEVNGIKTTTGRYGVKVMEQLAYGRSRMP